jgi:hypothetical protein
MQLSVLFAYAYLLGIAVSACAAKLAEIRVHRPAGMREPFVSADHILRSIALIAIAGPYLLFCELKASHREASGSLAVLLTGLAVTNGWALALGIMLVEFMSVLTRPF